MSFEEAEILNQRAKAFLENAERLIKEGVYDLAAFNIEQYCQLTLKYNLLIITGAYPRTHSIMRLLRLLSDLSENIKNLLNNSNNILFLTKIEDAYIGARHLPRPYEESEVKDMLKFVKEVFKRVAEEV